MASYEDTDLSGYDKRVVRPDFERMLADVEAGVVDTIMVWRTDRLTRQPGCLERFLDACERHRVALTSVTEPFDVGTNTGLLMLRTMVNFGNFESAVKSERVARKHLELAEQGKPSGGMRGFGYEIDGLTVRKDEAALIREAAKRVLSGEAPWAVGTDFSERGVMGTTGGPFRSRQMARILRQPRIAGLREYHGEIVGEAAWPAIIDRETWEAVVATLNRRGGAVVPNARTNLLTGFLYCGRCGAKLAGQPCHGRRSYFCLADRGGCNRLRINAEPLEAWVTDHVMKRVDRPATAAAGSDGGDEGADARAELVAVEERLAELADLYAGEEIGRVEWMRARRGLETRQEAARTALARTQQTRALAAYGDGGALRGAWPDLPLDQRRVVIAALVDRVVIAPAVKGRSVFDPKRIEIIWRV